MVHQPEKNESKPDKPKLFDDLSTDSVAKVFEDLLADDPKKAIYALRENLGKAASEGQTTVLSQRLTYSHLHK